jgi:YidC/Oxa1 family membrane protein insertase
MDRNSLIGLGLIGGILILWLWLSGPSKEQIARNKQIQDSVALVETKKAEEANKVIAAQRAKQDTVKAAIDTAKTAVALSDSAKAIQQTSLITGKYGDFAIAAQGKEELLTIENELIKATLSTKGGRIVSVELKNYKKADKKTLVTLFDADSSRQALSFVAANNLGITTDSLYFTTDSKNTLVNGAATKSITLKLPTSKPGSYIEYIYSLKGNDYELSYDINLVEMQGIISQQADEITLNWSMSLPTQEQHIEKERQIATVYWKAPGEDESPDYINPLKEEEKSIPETQMQWVAFKHQFFTSAVIANTAFTKGTKLKTVNNNTSLNYVKKISADLGMAYNHGAKEKIGMKFYFGPNHYYTLKDYKIGLEKMIPIGWSIFSFLNTWLIIPVFNWLMGSGISYGIIILVLTLIIKTLLFPIAYKTYLSSAKMRLLKPELDIINTKFGEDPMKKNQETMALYRKAGASPFSGCIPALIQIPILIALFNFFPASIELRQQGFLWAGDLSTYDSIWSYGYVPVINSIYGDHVSLFALLMFVSTIVYTWMNQKLMPMNNTQMPGMQFMMYLMPVIFLSFMNSYSAGLSWYYFLANMITFAQTLLMRKFVDDKKLRAKIDNNMKKPAKKSGFQQRLEDMQRQRAKQISGKK